MLARNVFFQSQRTVCTPLYELSGLTNTSFPFEYQSASPGFRSDNRFYLGSVHLCRLQAYFQLLLPSFYGIAIEAWKAWDPVHLKISVAFFLNSRYPYGKPSDNTPFWVCFEQLTIS